MTFAWLALILLCLLMYVALDGYDLGIGIATLFERDGGRRREMLELVAVAWDGNETWLVLLGVALWAGFPLAFGTILPHAYLPLIVMLFSLIVRGVSVEMASQKPPALGWVKAFGAASLTAALAQGAAAGTLTARLAVTGGAFHGPAFGALGWFSALTAVTIACGYLALGYAYTKWKATSGLRVTAGRRGTVAAVAAALLTAACLCAVNATAAPLYLTPGRAFGFGWLLAFAAGGAVLALVTLRPGSRYDALSTAGLVTAAVTVLLALVVARYPMLAPPGLTVGNTASPGRTMEFLAIGIGLDVPLVLFYTWYAHHAFRGKQDTPSPRPPEGADPRLGATDDH
jgi:cytochrome d ubiquinol oxidase subunit II